MGAGAMGEVWRALDPQTGALVAVKRVRLGDRRRVSALADEVRAVSALHHRHVVRVFDHGQEEEGAWVSMPLADGTLGTSLAGARDGDRGWTWAREVLRQVLAGLAHAHARGVVHRDVKPENILRFGPESDPTWVLSDFGLAWSARSPGGPPAGTLPYMAPELFRLGGAEIGPWTDLYAVGVLAWELVCGRLPFHGTPTEIARAHVAEPLPPLPSGLPEGLPELLSGLLEKSPSARIDLAATASAWLAEVGEGPASGAAEAPTRAERRSHVRASGRARTRTTPVTTWSTWLGAGPTQELTSARAAARELPVGPHAAPQPPAGGARSPVTEVPDWREGDPGLRLWSLVGPGVGLLGLRVGPLIGRESERDQLWEALREVVAGSGPRVCLVRGGPGMGRSRVARWVAERAHEVGLGVGVVPPEAGLTALVTELCACHGVPPGEAGARVEAWAAERGVRDPADVALLATVVRGERPAGPVHALHDAIARGLGAAARHRALVAVVEDLERSPELVAFASRLRVGPERVPVLLVATASPAGADGRGRLGEMADRDVELGPLALAEIRELLVGAYGTEVALAQRLAEHAGGNPRLAIQLLAGLVHGGRVVERGGRLCWPDGEALIPPVRSDAGLHELESVLGDPRQQWAMERAAVLGSEVVETEWAAACKIGPGDSRAAARADVNSGAAARAEASDGGPELSPALVELALDRGWLRRTPGGLAFAGSSLWGALRERARAGGRWRAHHLACAEAVRDSDRAGRHLLEAGEVARAAGPLVTAANARLRVQDCVAAIALCHALFDAIGSEAPPPEAVEGATVLARAHLRVGERDAAERWARRGVELAATRGPYAGFLAYLTLGEVERSADPEAAVTSLRTALRFAEVAGDLPAARRAAILLSNALLHVGDARGALRELEAVAPPWAADDPYGRRMWLAQAGTLRHRLADHSGARAAYEELERCSASDSVYRRKAVRGLAHVAMAEGDREVAERLLERSVVEATRVGDVSDIGLATNDLAAIAVQRRQWGKAERLLREARAIRVRLGERTLLQDFNLASIQVQQGRIDEARPALEALAREAEGRVSWIGLLRAALAACHAGDPRLLAEDLAAIQTHVDGQGVIQPDAVALLEIARARAAEHGDEEGAATAARLAALYAAGSGRPA